jgi:hypothetical protein
MNKSADIEDTIARGATPIISYKPPGTPPDTAGLLAGTYDSMIVAAKNYLLSLNTPLTVSFWHEPHNEILPAEFIAGSIKFLDLFGVNANISHGPILNGFLMDSTADKLKFAAFYNEELLTRWDFLACDIYQNGTNAAPGTKMPSRAAQNLVDMMTAAGHPDMPLGIGEYNALSAAGISDAAEVFASTPQLWFCLLWIGVANSNGIDWRLTDAPRAQAFNDTLLRFQQRLGTRKQITLRFGPQ